MGTLPSLVWIELCRRALAEQDPKKFRMMCRQLMTLLEEENAKFDKDAHMVRVQAA